VEASRFTPSISLADLGRAGVSRLFYSVRSLPRRH